MPSHRKRSSRYTAPAAAIRHMAERADLSRQFGGIDHDIERIFLTLPERKLSDVLESYGSTYGATAEQYARETYQKWSSGSTKMSGQTAARLLELLPPVLSATQRFDLVKKLRAYHFQRKSVRIQSSPASWRHDLVKPLQELVGSSATFKIPEELKEKATWLMDGDIAAAQSLLAAAEQDEAAVRIAYVEEEMRRIEALMSNIDTTRRLTHTLTLPQGDITLQVELPQRTLMQRLTGWMR